MTTKLEQAARQAIEFIVDCEYGKAELALREALDHSGETNEMVIGWDRVKPEAIASDPLYQQGFVDGVEEGRNHVAEQAEQEPVGVVEGSGEWGIAGVLVAGVPIGTKLYAAPVRTKDLTDEELDALWHGNTEGGWRGLFRAVIAADREKNK